MASEHHTKEVPELAIARDPRLITEAVFGGPFLRRFAGWFAVTDEILRYETVRAGVKKPGFVTYNAISPNRYPVTSRRSPIMNEVPRIKLVFASGAFPPWQGLDIFMDAFENQNRDCELHICGKVPESQAVRLRAAKNVVLHGSLDAKQLLEVYAACDVGVASFGLHRNKLKQATSLKVREYLACGLPVVLGHEDPAFPRDFPFLCRQRRVDLNAVVNWCAGMQSVTRERVFQAAEPYISIDSLVRRQYEGLDSLFGKTAV